MAQNLVCVGRERSGPAGPSASFVSSSCLFHMWPSCRQTRETSWSRCRSLEYHLQGDKVSTDNTTCLNCAFNLAYEMEKMREKPANQTFLFLLLGDICYDVVHIIGHNVALFPLWRTLSHLVLHFILGITES